MADPVEFGIEIDLTTFDKLRSSMVSVIRDIGTADVIERALLRCGKKGEAAAKDLLDEKIYFTPESPNYVRTGTLRRQTVADPMVTRTSEGITETVRSKTYYAIYVEMGTSKMPARAYMLPATQMNQEWINNEIANALAEYLKNIFGQTI